MVDTLHLLVMLLNVYLFQIWAKRDFENAALQGERDALNFLISKEN